MKLSVSTWTFNDKGREEAFKRIADFGVQGIEIIAHQPCFHVSVDMSDEQIGYVKELLTAYGLDISAISPATEFLQFDEASMQAQIDHMREVVDLCTRLGADHARIFAGGRIPQDRTLDECIEAATYGLQESVKIAREKGVRISVENHGQFGRTFEPFFRVMEAVPDAGITLHTSGIQLMADDYLDMVRQMAPRIVHTHLNDQIVAEDGSGWFVPLGQGALDIPAILEILEDAGYKGYYNLEYAPQWGEPTEMIWKSLAYLKDHLG